jgi:hypothetical protein
MKERGIKVSDRVDLDLELKKRTWRSEEKEESEEENPKVLHRQHWKSWSWCGLLFNLVLCGN